MPHRKMQDRSQVVPFPDANDIQFRIARCFSLLNNWHAAISGQSALSDVVTILTRQVQACNVSLYRFRKGRAAPVVAAARMLDDKPAEHSRGTLAAYLLAHHADQLKPGSMWRLAKLREMKGFAGSSADLEWSRRKDVLDIALVVLERTDDHLDVFEMMFDVPPKTHPDFPPALVTTALAEAWTMRAPGLVTRLIRKNASMRNRPSQIDGWDILGPNNICGLSRAEQRVIQMLADGEKAKGIADALHLSVATVRTHLRNIYAKTQTAGQVELIALLNDRKETA